MAATAPILPVSQMSLLSNPEARVFFSKISESAKNAVYNRRPWAELVDYSTFSKPESMAEAAARIRKNWNYFRINYAILLSVAVAFSLISHPFSLILLMVLLGGWLFLYFFRNGPLVLYNRHFSDTEILGLLTVMSFAVVFFTDVMSVVISATLVGLAIVCAHGAFRAPEDLFLPEHNVGGVAGRMPFASSAATYV